MSGLLDAVVAVAVVAWVLVRQLKARRVTEGGRWWLLPVVLVFLAVKQGGLVDSHHQAASVALLSAEIVVGGGMGVVWAFTARLWRDEEGIAWSKGTKATAAAWIGGILLRVGIGALGVMMGVHEGSGATMLALAAVLLVRRGVLAWRTTTMDPFARPVTAIS